MIGAVAHPHIPPAPGAAPTLDPSLRRRAYPSPAEQARREAWGKRFGPLVGGSIRLYIARNGG